MSARKRKRQILKGIDKSIQKRSIVLYEQVVSGEIFTSLPAEEQYALLVLGHVVQEISWLQRMLYIARENIAPASEIEKDGDAFQLLFLTRLMLGKLKEFDTLLRDEKKIVDFLVKNLESLSPGNGIAAVESVQAKFLSNSWIAKARNKHFLHYPKFNDVKSALGYVNEHWDYTVYHGEISTLTLYKTSDAFANLAWFDLADGEDPFRGLNNALDALLSIALEALTLIERAIGNQLGGALSREGDTKKINMTVRSLSQQRFDFFCVLESGSSIRSRGHD